MVFDLATACSGMGMREHPVTFELSAMHFMKSVQCDGRALGFHEFNDVAVGISNKKSAVES
jgi:hypothetical protein